LKPCRAYSGFAPENLTTFAHFSVSDAIKLVKSAGDDGAGAPPRSIRRALNSGSASPALIVLLSFSTISAGVFFAAPIPNQAVAS